ncbi:Vacuolar cation/proton exchanger 1b, partial [Bienertia sinuspersici]
MEMRIAILALCQKNRSGEKQADVNCFLLLLGLLCHISPLLFKFSAKTTAQIAALLTLNLSRVCSIIMLIAYCVYLIFQLWTHRQFFEAQ